MSSNIFSSTHLFDSLIVNADRRRMLVFYKYADLFLTSKRPPNRTGLLFNSLSSTNTSSEVRPIIGIISMIGAVPVSTETVPL